MTQSTDPKPASSGPLDYEGAGSRGKSASRLPFISVIVVLAIAAAILNILNFKLGLHFKKEAVPQPRDFHTLPAVMGKWLQISQDSKLDPQVEEVLGTQQYVYRDFIQVDQRGADLLVLVNDAKAHTAATRPVDLDAQDNNLTSDFNGADFDHKVSMVQAALKDKTAAECTQIVRELQAQKEGGVVNLGLTYYTGLVDTVAHIPDRCYIADGYEPSSYETPTWDIGNGMKQSIRFIAFDDVSGNNRVAKCVAYVFNTNGHYESDPIGVRRTLENLTERYGYYAKIELMSIVGNVKNTSVAQSTMNDFLASARPQIETCFPDWNALKHSK